MPSSCLLPSRASAEAELQQRIYELYFPRRHYFLSDRPEAELPARLSDAGLLAQAARVRETLALPVSPLLKRILPEDPLGAFPGILERLAGLIDADHAKAAVEQAERVAYVHPHLFRRHSANEDLAATGQRFALDESIAADGELARVIAVHDQHWHLGRAART